MASKASVLYIDDEQENLVGFKYMFRRDYDLGLALSAQAALEELEQRRYDVIISDQRMPDMTGVEFFEQIRDRYPHAIRMILTGYSDFDAVVDAINKGKVYHFFRKPWIADEVRIVVANAMEMVRMDEQLRQADKLQAIGSLTSGIAHDFNNQIQCVLGYAHLIHNSAAELPVRDQATAIIRASERSADLVRQLSTFSRQRPIDTRTFPLHPLLQEVTELLGATVDTQVQLQVLAEAPCDTVRGDPSQLQSALMNLGINARDALDENGGTITFSTRQEHCAQATSLGGQTLAAGDYLVVQVADDGCGMDGEVQERLFEPFFTTKPLGKGTGLGMAAVYGTVIGMEGTITIDSAPGAGTRYDLWLPLASGSATTGQAERPTQRQEHGRQGRVLVADDDRAVCSLIADVIAAEGFATTTCHDGDEALAALAEAPEDYAGVIMDLRMPGTHGEQLLQALAQRHPHLALVVLSGNLPERLRDRSDLPPYRLLQKPCSIEDLRQVLQEDILGARS